MVYKRKGRPTLYFSAKLKGGYFKDLSTGTSYRPLAVNINTMWEALAEDHRAWDLLELVTEGKLGISALFDLWNDTDRNPREMRRRLNDRDIEPLVAEWHAVYRRDVAADSAQHALAHVRALVTEGSSCPVSRVTTDWLTAALAKYPGSRNTIRKVHSSWSVFFTYLTDVHGLFPANPMDRVKRPRQERPPIQFLELDEIERVIAYQQSPALRALYTLLYGTGLELSVALGLLKLKILVADKTIIAAGTKAHTRNRELVVDDWAWPAIQKYIRPLLPTAPLFPDWNRWTVSDWHRATVKALGLPEYPLKNARHSWAVRQLRAGVPIHVVQHQLGHATAKLTLDTYGAFIPSGVDRAAAAKRVTAYEKRRRQ
jgi:integrase